MRTTQLRTIEAFSEWVDDGEVITGAAADQQIKRTPLLDLDGRRGTRSRFNSGSSCTTSSNDSKQEKMRLQIKTKDSKRQISNTEKCGRKEEEY